jgi:hypothetical protein
MAVEGPKRKKGESDLLYRYRWVDTVDPVVGEPDNLLPLRQMLFKTPEKFYALYAEQQRRYEEGLEKEKERARKAKKVEEELPVEACEVLVAKMLDEWEGS